MRALLRRASRLATILLSVTASSPAGAALFVVNSLGDPLQADRLKCPPLDRDLLPPVLPGDACTLRDAVAAANFEGGDDEIVFNLQGTQTITVGAPLVLDDEEGVAINAPPLVIGGQLPLVGLVLEGPLNGDVFQINAGNAQLRNLTISRGDVQVAADASVVFQQTMGSATFAQDISGDGVLEKEGGGTLVLTGTNDFTGGIEIGLGTLQGDTGSIPGGTELDPGTVEDDGRLVFDQDDDDEEDFFGAISGTGSLEKIGDGTLFLRTPNSYSGGTTISDGTLIGFASGAAGSLQGDIVNNAELVFEQAADGTFADDITGSGRVEKTGPGTLTLTGSNRFGGTLDLSEGILIGDSDAIPGNVDIESDAQLIFDQAGNGSHSGNITGGGGAPPGGFTLIKRGTGSLTLTGNNNYAGGTLVEAGVLEGTTQSLQGLIQLTAPSTLAFAQNTNGTFDGELAGTGALRKSGSGALTFTETLGFVPVAATMLQGGRLVIGVADQGAGAGTMLPGDLAISDGGTLAGIGEVAGLVTVAGGGRIAPGGGLDTLRVGSASFASGSALEVQISDDDTDLLQAGGNVAIDPGAMLDVTLTGVAPGADFTQTVLTAGSVTGGPFTDPEDLFFFTLTTVQDANSVSIDVTPTDATLTDPEVARTRNQRAVAAAFEEALALAPDGSDIDTVFGEISTQTENEISNSLDQMAGEQLTQFSTTRLAIDDRFQTSLQDRIRGLAWSDSEALLAEQTRDAGGPVLAADPVLQRSLPGLALAPSGAWPLGVGGQPSMSSVLDSGTSFQPLQGENGFGAWLDGYGLFGALDGDSDIKDLDYTIGGFSLGLDYLVAKSWLLGIAGGYAYSTLDSDGLSGDATSNTGQGGLYAGYVTPWLRLGASGRFGYSAMETRRDIDFMGRSADGDFSGWDAGGRAEAALDLVRFGPVELQPLASFTYTHVQQDSFDESGADSLDLDVDEQTIDSVQSAIGARFHGLFQIDETLWFHPEFSAHWLHEYGDRERELDARIGGTPGAVFTVRGAEPDADAGVLGVRWTVVSAGRLHAFADYDVVLSSSLVQQGVSAGFKVVW